MATQSYFVVFVAIMVTGVVRAQLESREPPQPYSFEYRNVNDDGSSSFHASTGDGTGRVTGSYGLTDIDGRDRVVEYVADELGYRATVTSNEQGVSAEAGSPADVVLRTPGSPVAAPQPLPARRVIVQPAPSPIYLRPAPRPIAVAPSGGYRVITIPRPTSGYRVVSSPIY